MHKLLHVAIAFAVLGCGNKQEDKPAPAPAPTPAPAAAPAPAPAPVVPDPAPKPVESAACEVKLQITADAIAISGAATGTAKQPADLAVPLGKLDRGCAVLISADASIKYQQIVTVIDQVTKDGFKKTGLDIQAKSAHADNTGTDVKDMPIIVAKADGSLMVDGKELGGKPLKATLEASRQTKPGDSVILQADQSLAYSKVKDILEQATAAGYPNVMFAVKSK